MGLLRTALPAKLALGIEKWRAQNRLRMAPFANYVLPRTQFKLKHGYAPDFTAPTTHNERVFVRKLKDRNPLFPIVTDKMRARNFVDERLGAGSAERLMVPNLAHVKRFDDLPPEIWDQDVMLKATHGCGMNIEIARNDDAARQRARRKARSWLRKIHGKRNFEWAYLDLTPSLIAEPLLASGRVRDTKLYFYDGVLRWIMPEDHLEDIPRITIYRPDGTAADMQFPDHGPATTGLPECLDQMIEVAKPLAEGLDMLRVDFMEADGRFYLGELTLYDASGLCRFMTRAQDQEFASFWLQPHLGVD